MIRKIIKGIIASSAIAILPVLGNIKMYYSPQIWILFAIGLMGSIFQPDYNLIKDKSNTKDKGTEAQIIWSVYISQLLAVLEASYLRFPDSVKWNMVTTVSLIIMILGLMLRTWSIYTLGNYFTMHLAIQKEHKIIRKGPYKYLRHPSYIGAFLTYWGTTIFLHSWFSLIVAAIILSIAWLRRMHYEEKLLIEKFGEEYKSYCKTAKRAIPGLW
jgi:protein-S-isoprenylcysteine O-methyltransferase